MKNDKMIQRYFLQKFKKSAFQIMWISNLHYNHFSVKKQLNSIETKIALWLNTNIKPCKNISYFKKRCFHLPKTNLFFSKKDVFISNAWVI